MRRPGPSFIAMMPMLWCVSGLVAAQQPATPRFEVVSVKANSLRNGIRGHSFPGDRFEATNVPLRDLILVAYGDAGQPLPDSQVSGGPSWIDSDRFDISARVPGDSLASVAQKQLMLRALLAERFQLAVHHEMRDLPVYALALAKRDGALGPRLRRAEVDCEALLASQPGRRERCVLYALPSGQLMLRGQTMNALASAFATLLERVVLNRTGLTGGFDADAAFDPNGLPGMAAPPGVNHAADAALSLFTAIEEQLGLKLESTRGHAEVLVIDRVERPSEN